jgi:hypothetical protein
VEADAVTEVELCVCVCGCVVDGASLCAIVNRQSSKVGVAINSSKVLNEFITLSYHSLECSSCDSKDGDGCVTSGNASKEISPELFMRE